jgi:hypothetical protein
MEGVERFRHGFPFATSRELQVQGAPSHRAATIFFLDAGAMIYRQKVQ